MSFFHVQISLSLVSFIIKVNEETVISKYSDFLVIISYGQVGIHNRDNQES